MSVKVAYASQSETGGINGTKGDSTGKEVLVGNWYNMPATFVAIPKDESVRNEIAKQAEYGAKNDKIGYGESDRNTLNTEAKKVGYQLKNINTTCNTDCSAYANVCCVSANLGTYGSNGWTTSTMKKELSKLNVAIVTDSSYIKSENYAVKGSIYVKEGEHTFIAIEDGCYSDEMLKIAGIKENSSSSAKKSVKGTGVAHNFSASIAGKYKVYNCSYLNLRNSAGNDGTDKTRSLVEMPKNTVCQNYGYYDYIDGTKWLYIVATVDDTEYTGFSSSKYLKKM